MNNPKPPLTEADLSELGRQILEHWRQQRPTMVKQMQERGDLVERALKNQQQVEEYQQEMRKRGSPEWQIQESSRELWILPSEEDQPQL